MDGFGPRFRRSPSPVQVRGGVSRLCGCPRSDDDGTQKSSAPFSQLMGCNRGTAGRRERTKRARWCRPRADQKSMCIVRPPSVKPREMLFN